MEVEADALRGKRMMSMMRMIPMRSESESESVSGSESGSESESGIWSYAQMNECAWAVYRRVTSLNAFVVLIKRNWTLFLRTKL